MTTRRGFSRRPGSGQGVLRGGVCSRADRRALVSLRLTAEDAKRPGVGLNPPRFEFSWAALFVNMFV